ncbi:dTDP-glucose 4,6-dehydratase, partial [Streptomyces sp. NRRL F-6602]
MLLSRPGSRGLTITVLDKLSYAGNPANLAEWEADERFRFRRGDICDRALLDEVLPGADCVVHFAAESHVDRSIEDGDVFLCTNVLGTQ